MCITLNRGSLYEEFGDDLFTKFAKISTVLEKRLADWGSEDDEGDDEEGGGTRKGLPEKKRKKLLDPKTWERDGQLVEIATKLRAALGDTLFENHNLFRDRGTMGMGMMGSAASTIPLLTLSYSGSAAVPVALPTALRPIAPFEVPTATKHLVFSSGMGMGGTGGMGGMGGGMMQFLIDGKSFDPARVDLTSRVNQVEQWTIENRSSMDHPFHLHGTQFQVVSRTRGGVTILEAPLAWRDVVNVPALESVVFNVVQHEVGKRMYHCHILEHEDQGMMGVLDVVA